jgi:hypothetical protein
LKRGKTLQLQSPGQILNRTISPLTIAAGVAVLALVAVALMVFGPEDNPQDAGAGMITAAAVSRAGAVLLPSDAGAPQAGSGGN